MQVRLPPFALRLPPFALRLPILLRSVVVLVLLAALAPAAWAEGRIEVEIAAQPGLPVTSSQKWYKLLIDLGVEGLRIRSYRQGDQPQITNRGTADRPRYEILGVLTGDDVLVLQGGRFTSRDRVRLKQFFDDLRSEGIAGATEEKQAYGLTRDQLVAVAEDLTPPVAFSTKDVPLGEVVSKASDRLRHAVAVDPAAAARLRAAGAVAQEFQDTSLGTALAIALAGEGLMLQPHKPRGEDVVLRIAPRDEQSEAWPTGWPPQSPDRELVPRLFEFLDVEIAGIALPQALGAIEERLQIPFLFDRAALARHQIVPEQVQVSIPAGRTYYKRIVDRMLSQAKLKGELRVDEAGSPFLWITTIKR